MREEEEEVTLRTRIVPYRWVREEQEETPLRHDVTQEEMRRRYDTPLRHDVTQEEMRRRYDTTSPRWRHCDERRWYRDISTTQSSAVLRRTSIVVRRSCVDGTKLRIKTRHKVRASTTQSFVFRRRKVPRHFDDAKLRISIFGLRRTKIALLSCRLEPTLSSSFSYYLS